MNVNLLRASPLLLAVAGLGVVGSGSVVIYASLAARNSTPPPSATVSLAPVPLPSGPPPTSPPTVLASPTPRASTPAPTAHPTRSPSPAASQPTGSLNPTPTGPPPSPQPTIPAGEGTNPTPTAAPPTTYPSPAASATPTGPVPSVNPTVNPSASPPPGAPTPTRSPAPGALPSENAWDWTVHVDACAGMSAAQLGKIVHDTMTPFAPYPGSCGYLGTHTYPKGLTLNVQVSFYGATGKAGAYFRQQAATATVPVTGMNVTSAGWAPTTQTGVLYVTVGKYGVIVAVNGLTSNTARLAAARQIGTAEAAWVTALAPPVPPPPTKPSPYPVPTVTTSPSPSPSPSTSPSPSPSVNVSPPATTSPSPGGTTGPAGGSVPPPVLPLAAVGGAVVAAAGGGVAAKVSLLAKMSSWLRR